MSSDYIPRLRRELLRAGGRSRARSRWTLVTRGMRPLAATVGGLLLVALVLVWVGGESEETAVERPDEATLQLSYRVDPPGDAAAQQTARVLRARLAAAGIRAARVSVASSGALTITAPAAVRADVAALTQRGRLAFYDWERSVLGPRGVPAPGDVRVTGGANAGHDGAVSRREADARAARVAPGGADAPPGGRVVRTEAAGRWFALGGRPALTDADIRRAGAATDPASRDPVVTIDFTPRGQSRFAAFTRTLARRGRARVADGVSPDEANQHFAMVLDDRILAVPRIDFRENPDGIAGAGGAMVQGGLSPRTARVTAAILTTGPLPAALVPER